MKLWFGPLSSADVKKVTCVRRGHVGVCTRHGMSVEEAITVFGVSMEV